jgi:site-specific recombinase XerD
MARTTRSLHSSAPNYSGREGPGPGLAALLSSFRLALRAEGLSEKTYGIYADAVRRLDTFRLDRGMPPVPAMSTEHVREFLGGMQDRNAPSTVNQRYRSLGRFYKWLLDEGEIRENPMVRIKPPKVAEQLKEHYGTEAVERVLKACGDRSWTSLRDRAMVLVLYDTGVRAAELCGMRMDDVDMDEQTIKVTGKGGKERLVPIGNKAALALDKYLRKRPATVADRVWLSTRGEPMTFNALRMSCGGASWRPACPSGVSTASVVHSPSPSSTRAGTPRTCSKLLAGTPSRWCSATRRPQPVLAPAVLTRGCRRRTALGDAKARAVQPD